MSSEGKWLIARAAAYARVLGLARSVCRSPGWGTTVSRMIINGATVDDSLVLALARSVKSANLAHKLRAAHRFRTEIINLSSDERTAVLAALDGSSPLLEELRGQLVEHPAWRSTTRVS